MRTFLIGRTGIALTSVLLTVLGMSLAFGLYVGDPAYAADSKATQANSTSRAALYQMQDAFTSLVDEMLPSVVSITSTKTVESRQAAPWFDDFFKNFPFPIPTPDSGQPERRQESSSFGSGVIVRSDGYILTNDHVVGGADKVTVTLNDGRTFEGTVLRDTRSDLAVIRIDATGLPAAKLADSNNVKVGQWAVAIGSPFGLDQTVTVGIISATGRQARVSEGAGFYPNLIQTDASINPGNSGGPLISIDGEVIGINTLIRSSVGGNIGIGFAIPSNSAKFVLDQLIAHGKVTRGYLGIMPRDLTPKIAERLGVTEGVWVETVEVDTPADKAGMQVEDVILEFDGKKVTNEIAFREMVQSSPPGKEISLVVVRDKARQTLKVTIGEPSPVEVVQAPKEAETKLGFGVASITPELAEKHKLADGTRGIVVTSVTQGSPAARAGVQAGQIVVRANDREVRTVDEFTAATKDLKAGDTVRMVLQTTERRMLVEFTLN